MASALGILLAKRPPGSGPGIDAWIAEWRAASPLAQGGICMECRSVLAEGESCHGRVATTWARWSGLRGRASEQPRRIMRQEPDADPFAARMRLMKWIMVAIGLVSIGVAAAGDLEGLFGVVLGLGGATASRTLERHNTRARRLPPRRPVPEPGGVASDAGLPELSIERPPLHGRLTGDGGIVAFEERVCLDHQDTDVVFARLGETSGATVTLDDGRLVHLPPGRVRLVDEGGHTREVATAAREGTRLERLEARAGDHVTLVATLEPESPTEARGYRDLPPTTLRAVGEILLSLHAARVE